APSLEERDRLVVSAPAQLEPFVDRVTLTLPALCAGHQVVFLVTGEDKADAVGRAFAGPPGPGTPASLVRSTAGRTLVVLDTAAASPARPRNARCQHRGAAHEPRARPATGGRSWPSALPCPHAAEGGVDRTGGRWARAREAVPGRGAHSARRPGARRVWIRERPPRGDAPRGAARLGALRTRGDVPQRPGDHTHLTGARARADHGVRREGARRRT